MNGTLALQKVLLYNTLRTESLSNCTVKRTQQLLQPNHPISYSLTVRAIYDRSSLRGNVTFSHKPCMCLSPRHRDLLLSAATDVEGWGVMVNVLCGLHSAFAWLKCIFGLGTLKETVHPIRAILSVLSDTYYSSQMKLWESNVFTGRGDPVWPLPVMYWTSLYSSPPLDTRHGIYPLPPLVLTLSGGHRNPYDWQAGSTHPTRMLSCGWRPSSI